MEFFITWAVILGLLVVPAFFNYLLNLYFTPPELPLPPRVELLVASLCLTFGALVSATLVTLLVSLGYDELKEEISDFVNAGLVGFGQDRPIALTGVLTAVSAADMALMALLGSFRIPGRLLR